jgi:hypothetical protein
VAQVVEHLPSNHKALSSNRCTLTPPPKNKERVVLNLKQGYGKRIEECSEQSYLSPDHF